LIAYNQSSKIHVGATCIGDGKVFGVSVECSRV
jgi:hypothetical protein